MNFYAGYLCGLIRLKAAPTVYGAFHVASLCVILGTFILFAVFGRKKFRGSNVRRACAVFGFSLLALEIVKQLIYSYVPLGRWQYDFSRFPFQFCSTPVYIAIAAAFLPDGRIRKSLLCFLATYTPVAGCAVLFWPSSDVFSEILFIDIHTMLWHGGMLLFGLYIWLSGEVAANMSTVLRAFAVFLPLNFAALALNEAEHALNFAGEYEFNMFYTSRYYTCHIPLLDKVQAHAPYFVFFCSFILLLSLGNVAVTLVMMLIEKIGRKYSVR